MSILLILLINKIKITEIHRKNLSVNQLESHALLASLRSSQSAFLSAIWALFSKNLVETFHTIPN